MDLVNTPIGPQKPGQRTVMILQKKEQTSAKAVPPEAL
jgi:hypothetical protein